MEYLIAIVISLATGLAIPVLAEKAPRLSRWLVLRAARLYAEPKASRFEEEWLQHLSTRDGPYSMLWHGLGCFTTGLRRSGYFKRSVSARVGVIIVQMISILYFLLDKVHDDIGPRKGTFRGELIRAIALFKSPKALAVTIITSIPVISLTFLVIALVPLTTSKSEEVEMTRDAARKMGKLFASLLGGWHVR